MNINFQTDLKFVDGDTVSCKGGDWSEAHPLIYLDLSSGKIAVCPYCSMKYKKK
tara:strand:+ start:103 stop:264 length:162 start_codon:yes stop_codon:yes gene_type:complete